MYAQKSEKLDVKNIMYSIANEERNFNHFIPVQSVIKMANRIEGFDPNTMGALFEIVSIQRSLFGHGYIHWQEQEAESVKFILEIIIDASQKMRNYFLHPYDAMIKALRNKNSLIEEHKLHEIMAVFIECESLADFVYVCPVERDWKQMKKDEEEKEQKETGDEQ